MDTDARGQLGGMEAGEAVRRKMARESREWTCAACGRGNAEVMREQEEAAKGEDERKEEEVPEELKLAFREDLGKGAAGSEKDNLAPVANGEPATATSNSTPTTRQPPSTALTSAAQPPASRTAPAPAAPVQQRQAPVRQQEDIPAWIDKAIIGIVFAIIAILWLRFFG